MSQQRFTTILGVLFTVLLLAAFLPAATTHHSGTAKKKTHTSTKSASAKSSHKSSASTSSHKKSSATLKNASVTCKGKHCKKAKTKKVRGQQGIDSDRTREIQAALIREHYLDGEPSGSFDQRTKDALSKYQQDNGWQNKVVPDSRALIKLGLGPSREGLLNPESAAIASPYALGAEREIPGGSVASAANRK